MDKKQDYSSPECCIFEVSLEGVIATSDPSQVTLPEPGYNGFGNEELW